MSMQRLFYIALGALLFWFIQSYIETQFADDANLPTTEQDFDFTELRSAPDSATFTYENGDVRYVMMESKKCGIMINGAITPDTEKAYFTALAIVHAKGCVAGMLALNSDGGYVYESLLIGASVRYAKFETVIPEDAKCSSACAYIFAAGTIRHIASNSKLGLHQIRSSDTHECDLTEANNQGIFDYLKDMLGPDPAALLFNAQMATPCTQMHWFSSETLIAHQIAKPL